MVVCTSTLVDTLQQLRTSVNRTSTTILNNKTKLITLSQWLLFLRNINRRDGAIKCIILFPFAVHKCVLCCSCILYLYCRFLCCSVFVWLIYVCSLCSVMLKVHWRIEIGTKWAARCYKCRWSIATRQQEDFGTWKDSFIAQKTGGETSGGE